MSLFHAFKTLRNASGRHSMNRPPTSLSLEDDRVFLRLGQPRDWKAWEYLRKESHEFLQPWEPKWSPENLTFDMFSNILRKNWQDWKMGRAYSFLIFAKQKDLKPYSILSSDAEEDPEGDTNLCLVGGISLTHVERGAAQKGRLGYWIGQPFAHQGFMSRAAKLTIDFAFEKLELHRLEANSLPENEISADLLTRLGFQEEGLAKGYLKINDTWRDLTLWGKVNENYDDA